MTRAFEYILAFPAILFAVTFHEYAHGWVANRLGDPTARMMGRLTLNPLRHLDMIGSIVVPLALLLFNSPVVFAWAKPVPVNFFALRNPKRDMIWVSLAGPASNLSIALIAGLIFRLLAFFPEAIGSAAAPVYLLLAFLILINCFLALFNLIPIPPLDGSKILVGLLPGKLSARYLYWERYGMVLLIGLLLVLQLLNLNILFAPVRLLAALFAGGGILHFI